jgi:anti-sigma-K factor RskA
MTRDHALIDELLAARALDGLDAGDATLLERELAAHGDCEECRRLEIEHAEVAGMLALALDPRPVREDMADRIIAAGRTATAPIERLEARGDTRLGWWQAAFGVAAAVALVFAMLLATRDGGSPGVPGSAIVAFEGPAPGELAMSYTPGEPGALVWATGLPDPGPGKVYALWMIDDGEAARGACLAPERGAVAAFLDTDPSSADLLAVTVESQECPDAPTTDPVYTAELAAQ